MSKRIMVLATPKDLGDSDLKKFQIDYLHVHDTHISVNLQPTSAGRIRIFLGANPDAGPQDIVAGPTASTKIQNMIDAIEDAIKAKLEGA